jgi:GNAT superfamily N-acetyltransferase
MVSIRALRADDPRSGFRSGNSDLDRFFHRHAASNQFVEHIGATYVAVDDRDAILGFVTLAGATISADSFPSTRKRRLPSYPLSALRLARLAVGIAAQSRGIGTLLVRYAFAQALEQSARVGCIGVLVDAKPGAIRFYERLGFELQEAVEGQIASHPEPVPMFLHISTIKAAIGG